MISTDAVEGAALVSVPVAKPVVAQQPLLGRWLDLQTLSHAERYRNAYNNGDIHVFEDGQQRSLVEGKFKFDAQEKYAIGFRASSGRYFNWAYADYAGKGFKASLADPNFFAATYAPSQLGPIFASFAQDPAGGAILSSCQSAGWEFYVRELYFTATPVKAITVEFGSFGIQRGLSTEITTFDDDGYLTGERVRIHDAKHLFFDQVGYTNAFFGDISTVNVFDRGASFKRANYHQFFADKRFNSHVAVSAEFTNQVGSNTLREAAVFATNETRLIDNVRFETYQRVNSTNLQGTEIGGGSGYAVAAEKKFTNRFSGDAGFAAIDKDYGVYAGHLAVQAVGFTLNGDTYGLGKRPFAHASYKINPVITAFGFYTHAVGERTVTLNQQGLNVGLNFDLKALVNSEKLVF